MDYLKLRLVGEVEAADETSEGVPAVLGVHVDRVLVEPALRREGPTADITLVLLRLRGVLCLKYKGLKSVLFFGRGAVGGDQSVYCRVFVQL